MEFLLVGLGGFLGTVLRYASGLWLAALSDAHQFPLGTLFVNTLGCLLIGFLSRLIERHGLLGSTQRHFLIPGLIGGFTTFSAFGYETFSHAEVHGLWAAAGNVLANVGLGLLAVWAGRLLADALLG
ncbi:MAG: fluoride efflux transporter CrcB [Enhydrobacter sp.]|nr:fluoride efflux transporter CrcB [Enhydrobacter sp.]